MTIHKVKEQPQMNIIVCDDNEKDRKTLMELLQDYEQSNN
jgi:ABC-type metal ion transport system substrate-binding protein